MARVRQFHFRQQRGAHSSCHKNCSRVFLSRVISHVERASEACMMHLYDDHSAHAFNVARGGGSGHLINMSSDHSSASIRPSARDAFQSSSFALHGHMDGLVDHISVLWPALWLMQIGSLAKICHRIKKTPYLCCELCNGC